MADCEGDDITLKTIKTQRVNWLKKIKNKKKILIFLTLNIPKQKIGFIDKIDLPSSPHL